ncbi:hypothetical protein LIER_36159 [Lithospermum erythrorhizon]|uniref:Uncharacterized protein n=1 Tax=Lithospermum erythrorhizon TaxID=34254 RepID=A0AAV3P348_LITER
MEDFPDISSYYQSLKSIADQLANIGSPVPNNRLVFQLISGLTDAYANVGSQIRHGDVLPPFYKEGSMLVLEETSRAKKAVMSSSHHQLLSSLKANKTFVLTTVTPTLVAVGMVAVVVETKVVQILFKKLIQ